jgi:hypothetical protein
VSDELEALEQMMDKLRADVRRAMIGGDRVRAKEMRAELRDVERRWDDALARIGAGPELAAGSGAPAPAVPAPPTSVPATSVPATPAPVTPAAGTPATSAPAAASLAAQRPAARSGIPLPVREQVHQALTLLGAPAAPRLIVAVHEAFCAGRLASSRLTSLRRDEERSFRVAPYARPYYLCAALTADLLSPARGLLAVSTWSMDRRIIGPLSPRVDYLTAAIAVAGQLQQSADPDPAARRLLWRFAANIPRAASSMRSMTADEVAAAARAELAVHQDADSAHRIAAARRARSQLDDAAQLFGSGLVLSRQADSGA